MPRTTASWSRCAATCFIIALAMTLGTPPDDVGSFALDDLDRIAVRKRGEQAKQQPMSERLRFQATWNGVPVARGELTTDFRGGRAGGTVKLAGHAETNEALDLVWRMRDSIEATVATNPPAPSRFLLRQNENGRRRETTVVRDAKGRTLTGTRQRRGKPPRTATVPLTPDLHDPASLAYLIRVAGGQLTERRVYRAFLGTRPYQLTVTPAETAPVFALGRSWPSRRLRLSLRLDDGEAAGVQAADLWVTTGPERLPLRLEGRTYWGWIAIDLTGRSLAPRPDGPPPVA